MNMAAGIVNIRSGGSIGLRIVQSAVENGFLVKKVALHIRKICPAMYNGMMNKNAYNAAT